MLKPTYFNGKSEIVEQYFRDLEDYMLNDIAKFLLNAGEVGGKADRELFVLQQMGLNQTEITERLAKVTKRSKSSVRKVLQGSVMTSFSNDKEVLDKYFNGEFEPLDNPTITAVMDAEWQKTCGELENLTRTTMVQYNVDVANLLNDAEIRVATGNQSYSAAVCEVLDNYAKAGMMINYPTGARRSLEAAVRCCVVTSMNQTAAQVTNKYISEGGIEYVLVSAHTGARHSKKGGVYSHDEWQGKAYKIRGSEEGFPNLLESTGYDIDPDTGEGTVVNAGGLHGYNCRHSHQPWDKDLDNPWINADGTPRIDPEESLKKYKQQQEQRGMERSIRANKRQLNMKQAEIDNLPNDTKERAQAQADYDALAYKLRQKNQKYNAFCEEHNLAKQSDRLKAAGFGKAEASKANGRATAFEGKTNSYYGASYPRNWKITTEQTPTAEVVRQVNPKFSPFGIESEPYRKNCPNCVVAYVMRKAHGFDVEAAPATKGGSKFLNRHPEAAWDGIKEVMQFNSKDDIIRKLQGTDNAIYELIYKSNAGGHCIAVDVDNGGVNFWDVQSGTRFNSSNLDLEEYTDIKMWRVDNIAVSQRGITACKVRGQN